jgi:hypothetical protein
VPFERLYDDQVLILNPNFQDSSKLVGGADADLLTGDLLVDFKTTKNNTMDGRDFDQLFGYFLLARNQRRIDPTFPQVNRVGLYFSRHGYLQIWAGDHWTSHPQFPEIENWFIKHASNTFPWATPTDRTVNLWLRAYATGDDSVLPKLADWLQERGHWGSERVRIAKVDVESVILWVRQSYWKQNQPVPKTKDIRPLVEDALAGKEVPPEIKAAVEGVRRKVRDEVLRLF